MFGIKPNSGAATYGYIGLLPLASLASDTKERTITDDAKPTAVLVIHGIGQQMPMDTLRRFVTTVFGRRPDGSQRKIYSKLDRDSEFLDLRRLVLPKDEGRPRVDFYEVYWAPVLSGGSAVGVARWTIKMLAGHPQGTQMRQIIWTMRCALLALVLVATLLYFLVRDAAWLWWLAPLFPLVVALQPIIRGWGKSALTETLADASRWFAPRPRDILERDTVRRIGLDLLIQLHRVEDDGEQRYGRIVVFGHSLGSVVAYNIIRLAFDELRNPRPLTAAKAGRRVADRQPAAWNFKTECDTLATTGDVCRFQYFQSQLHAEQRDQGVPWLVTDFVTAGSPISHARDLWSSKVATFDARVDENEYPISPPLGEYQHSESRRFDDGRPSIVGAQGRIAFYRKSDVGPLIAHEASPFASTRWTNLYIPMKPWLGGDPVGGEVAPTMGTGVRDIAVRPSTHGSRALALPVAAHTWYWRRDTNITDDDAQAVGEFPDAVLKLAQVLNLRPGQVKHYEGAVSQAADPDTSPP